MRFAFVIRLGLETRPDEGRFEGWVEEVDSCIQRRFHSAEELLEFLGQRFDVAGEFGEKRLPASRPPAGKRAARKKRTQSE